MCLACEEEAFYRAYLDDMARKAAQAGKATRADAPKPGERVTEPNPPDPKAAE